MHVAEQLFIDSFDIKVGDEPATYNSVFEGWDRADRFGIVVDEPLGGLGASLLLQLAIAAFYAVDPDRRGPRATYPEIYLFHAGGPHGDYSNFDFWPPRKEVFVPSGVPLALLEAINDRGITRLAVPSRGSGDTAALGNGPNTWAEVGSAKERLRSCFAYDSSGHVDVPHIHIASSDERTKENIRDTLAMTTLIPEPGLFEDPHGPMAIDEARWIEIVKMRMAVEGPIDPAVVESQSRHFISDGTLEQSFRVVKTEEALAHLCAVLG
ncbi:hypothetical protein H5V45_09695 [Nocardioides sp. KIGAM211]|uniref:Uncharacterized protein n=1 Tax=Nocardioides luti TaxID=2761101 RepID=A0A7X0RG93_9ACTN|nr:hypothetical protein [Nocardioides luti]MBB6627595.1 hypothetical protein [Nocardioides luti]